MQYLSTVQKCAAYVVLLAQLFLPVSVTFSSVVYAAEQEKVLSNELPKYKYGSYSYLPTLGSSETPDKKTNFESQLAQGASQFGQILSNDNATESSINYVRGLGEGLINQKVNDWLNQYGKARVQLSTKKTGDLDFLAPFFDSEDSLLFSQLGFRYTEDRNTFNFGVGYRQQTDNWLWGVNSFYDYDMTGKNSRFGVGGELWFDYFKLAANGYLGLTDWHQSKISGMSDYDERPANGFDIRLEGYLPHYPQLGAFTRYEQYFGKNINLSDSTVSKTDLKDNPVKATFGVSYTPFPLMTIKGEKSYGDSNEAKIGFDFEYRLGVPLAEQLNPNSVGLMRGLKGNLYDFVDRNYNIVMQYRQQELINISLPQSLNAKSQETLLVSATVNKSKYGLKSITWSAPELINDGGNIVVKTPTSINLTVPKHVAGSDVQKYRLTAIAEDNEGNTSKAVVSWVIVEASPVSIKTIDFDMSGSVAANGDDGYDAAVSVQNEDGTPAANEDVLFEISGFSDNNQVTLTLVDGSAVSRSVKLRSATLASGVSGQGSLHVLTNDQGKASARISSTIVGEGKLAVSVNGGEKTIKNIRFLADSSTAKIDSITAKETSVVADGTTTNTLTVKVTDANGNILGDQDITLTADSALTLSATALKSGSDGLATATVKSSTSGTFNVKAKIKDKADTTYVTLAVTFVAGSADKDKSSLAVSPASIVADGSATSTVTLTLKDAKGNLVSNQSGVKFETTNSTVTLGDVTNNGDGTYSATLTSGKTAGTASISVKFGETAFAVTSASVTLTADTSTVKVNSITAKETSVVADGTTTNTLTVKVTDANGNILGDQDITLTADSELTLSATALKSGSDGLATATVKSSTSGTFNVKAKIKDKADTTYVTLAVTFVAGSADKDKSSLAVSPASIVADGSATSTIMLTLKDTNGNLVSNQSGVKFETTNSTVTLGDVTNNGDGTYSATLTSGKTAGTASISVKFGETAFAVTSASVTLTADTSTVKVNSITAKETSVVADGTTTNTLTVKVTDANGNVLGDQDITLTADSELTLSATALKSGSDGLATATVKSSTSGTFNVKAKIKDKADTTYVTLAVTFVAGSADKDKSSLAVSPASIVADGSATSTVTLTLKDAKGNLVSNQSGVKFETTNSTVTLGDVTNNGDGTYSATLTSGKTAGTASISVKFGETAFAVTSASVTLTADTSTVKVSSITAKETSVVADGTTTNTLTVKVTDANGNVLGDQDITLTADSELTLSATALKSGSDGLATATVKSSTSGTFNVKAKIKDKADTTYVTLAVTFVAGSADKDKSSLAVSPASIVADGSATSTVTLTLKDTNGNLVSNQSGVKFETTNSTVTLGDVTNNGDGTYSAILTSGKTAGTASISVKFGETAFAVTSASVTLTAGSAVATKSSLAVSPASIVADGSATSTIMLTLKDTNGNLVSNQSGVEFETTNSTVTLGDVTNNSDGTYSATLTSGKTAGTASISVKFGETAFAVTSASVTLTAGSAVATKSSLSVSSDSIVADGSTTSTVTLTLKDTNDNLVLDQGNVKFSTSLSGVTFSNVTNNGDGTYSATLKGTQAGSASITVTLNDIDFTVTSVSVTLTADTSTVKVSSITAKETSVVADGTTTNTLTVKVTDANGNVLGDQDITLTADSELTLSATALKSGSDGLATATVKSSTSGTFNVKAKIKDKADTTYVTLAVTFVAGSADKDKSSLAVSPASIVADGSATSTVTLTLKDAKGNLVSNQSGVKFETTNSTVTLGDVTNNGDGTYSATLTSGKTAGTASISVKFGETAFAVTSASITLTGSNADASKSSLAVSPASIVADGSATSTVTLTLKDTNGNLVSNQSGVKFETTNSTVTLGDVTNNGDGTYSATLTSGKTAGTASISVKFGETAFAVTSASVTLTADTSTVKVNSITAKETSVVADGTTTNTLTVKVTDANGNILGDQDITLTADSELTLSATALKSGSDGLATATVKSSTSGTFNVKAKIKDKADTTYVTLAVTFVAGSADKDKSSLAVSPASIVADGSATSTVTLTLKDAKGNLVSNQSGVKFETTNSTVTLGDVTNNGDGTYSATLTSGKTAGTASISVKFGETAFAVTSASVTLTADTSTVKVNSITAKETSVVADGTTTNTLTVKVTDANGNILGDQDITLTADSELTLSATALKSGSDGLATATVKSSTSGTFNVKAKIKDKADTTYVTLAVTFVAGSADKDKSSLAVSPASIVADGSATSTVTLTLKDAKGNLVSNQSGVKFETTNSTVTLGDVTNNGDGTYSATLTSGKTAGTASISVKFGETAFAVTSASVTLTADTSTVKVNSITAKETSVVADGTTTNTLTVKVTDANGNILGDQDITLTADSELTLSATALKSGSDGLATATVKSSTSGTFNVKAKIKDKADTTYVTLAVTFVADGNTAKVGSFTVENASVVADGESTNTLTVKVVDAKGNVLNGQKVTLIAGSGLTLSSTELTSGSDGLATATVKSSTSGSFELSANVKGKPDSDKKTLTVVFIAGEPVVAESSLTVSDSSLVADDYTTVTLTLTLKDAKKNGVPGKMVEFSSSLTGVTFGDVSDNENGTYTATIKGSQTGDAEITVLVNNTKFTVSSVTVKLTADSDSINAKESSLSASPSTITANNIDSSTLTLSLRDKYKNLVPGKTVLFTSDLKNVTISATTALGDGTYTATLKGKAAGTAKVNVKVDNEVFGVSSANIVLIGDSSTAKIDSFTAGNSTVVADGVATNTLTVKVIDANGNVLNNQNITLTADSGVTLSATELTTGSNGLATATVKSSTAGSYNVKAKFKDAEDSTNIQLKVSFIAGSVDKEKSSLSVSPASIVADGSEESKITLTLKDAQENVIVGQENIKFETTLSNVTISDVTDNKDGTYSATLKGTTAGIASLTVKFDTMPFAVASASVTLTAGSAVATKSSLSVSPASIVADGSATSTVTLTLKDAKGNLVSNQSGVKFETTNSTVTLGDVTNNGDGTYSATLTSGKTAGTASISVKFGETAFAVTSASVTLTADTSTVKVNSITAKETSVVADGTTTNTLTVKVTDANGNILGDQDITLTADSELTLSATALKSGSDGLATATVKSSTSGTFNVKAKIKDKADTTYVTLAVTFVAGSADKDKSSLAVSPASIVADGSATSTVTLTLKDAKGNLVSNQSGVKFETTNSTVTLGDVTNNGDGTYSATLTSGKTAGTASISVKFGETAFAVTSASVTLTADTSTVKVNSITAKETSVVADGTTTNTLTVKVTDANGNILGDQDITLTADSELTLSATALKSGSDGLATATVKSSTSGTFNVKAKIKDKADTTYVTLAVTFVAGSADKDKSSLAVSPASIVADGSATSTVTLTLKDAKGNLVSNQSGVKFETTNSTVTLGDVTNNGDGTYSATLTSGKTAGTASISVKFGETAFAVTSASVTLTADTSTVKVNNITAKETSVVADGTTTNTLTVKVTDANGNILGDQDITLTADSELTLSATALKSGSDGLATATVKSSTSGTFNVKAKIKDKADTTYVTLAVTFVAGSADKDKSSLAVSPASIVADGSATSTIMLTLKDTNGNLVSNQSGVEFETTNSTVTLGDVTNNGDGTYSATLTSGKTAGTASISVKFGETAFAVTSASVTLTADTSTVKVNSITAKETSVVADGTTTNTLTVKVTDANGNILGDQDITLTADSELTLSATALKSGSDGLATATVKSSTSGTFNVKAKIKDKADTTYVTLAVTFVAGSADKDKSSLAVSPASIVADGSATSTVTLTLKDAKGNLVSNQSGVKFETTNSTVTLGDVTNNGDGTYSATLTSGKTAGTASISVKFGETAFAVTSASVTLTAGSAVATKSSLSVSPASIVADGSATSTVTLTLKDTNDNLVLDQGNVKFSTSLSGVTFSNVTNNGDGTYSATLKGTQAGSASITVTLNDIDFTVTSVSVTLTADTSTVKVNSITAKETSVVADGTTTNTLTVKVTDANGNVLGDQDITLTADSELTLSATALKSGSDGLATATVKSSTSGTFNVKAKIKDKADTTYVTLAVTFVAGSADKDKSSLAVSPASIVADGSATSTVTLTLKDTNGNLVSNQSGVKFETTNSTVTLGDVTNNGDGTYSATLTSGKTAGTASISVKFGETAFAVASASVTLTAGSAVATKSSLAVSPASIVADGSATSTIMLTLKDTNGNLVSNQSGVEFETTNSTVTLGDVTNNGDGTYSATLTSGKTAGTASISVKFDETAFEVASVSVELTADSSTVKVNNITAKETSVVADGTTTNTLTVKVTDANGNILGDQDITLTADSELTLSATALKSGSDGLATATVKSSTSGTFNVKAKIKDKADTTYVTLAVTFVAGSADKDKSSLAVSPASIVADGSATSTVTLTLKDAKGNLVSNQSGVKFETTNSTVTLGDVTNNGDGTYSATLTSGKTAGTASISVKFGETAFAVTSASVTLTAGSAVANKSSFKVSSNSIVADDSETSTLTVTLKDSNDNPVIGASVGFTTTLTAVTFDLVNDNGDGTYTSTIKGKTAGVAEVKVSLDGSYFALTPVKVTLKPDSTTVVVDSITAKETSVVADGTTTNTLTVKVTDANGNILGDQDITLTADSALTLSATALKSGSDGLATATVKSSTSGTFNVKAKIKDKADTTYVTLAVTFVAGSAVATKSSLSISPTSILANDSETATITLTLKDAKDNLVIGQSDVSFSTSFSNTTISEVTDMGNGTYTATIKGKTAGDASVSVKLGETTFAVTSASVTLTADSSTAKLSSLTAETNGAVADDVAANVVKVVVVDANNNLLANQGVTLSASNDARLQVKSVITKTDGSATFEVYSEKSGDSVITATLATSDEKSLTVTINFVPGAANDENSSLVASKGSIVADNTATSTLTLTLKDDNGNLIAGQEKVKFETLLANVTISDVTDNNNGTYTATLKGKTAGIATVKTTLNGEVFSVAEVNIILNADASTVKVNSITAKETSVVADGTTTNTLTVKVTDANGNVLGDQDITLTADSELTLSATALKSGSDGLATATVKSSTSGTFNVKAKIKDKADTTYVTLAVTFVAGSADKDKSSLAVSPASIVADGSATSTVTLTLKDTNGNLVSNQSGVKFETTNSTVTLGDVTNNGDGTYSAILTSGKTAGTASISVKFGETAFAVTSASVTLTAGSAVATKSSLAVSPASIVADGSATSTIMLTLKDTNGNLVSNQSGVEFETTNSTVTLGDVTNNSDGTYSATLTSGKTAGTASISVKFGETAFAVTSASVTLTAGSAVATKSSLSVSSDSIVADGSTTSTVTLTLKDTNDNLVLDQGNVKFSTSLSGVTFSNVTNNGDGTYSATLKGTQAGSASITVTLNDIDFTVTSVSVTLTADTSTVKVSSITAKETSVVADGTTTNTLTVKVTDANGNILGDQDITLMADSELTLSATALKSGSDGLATATVKSSTSGTFNVKAKIKDKADTTYVTLAVTFVADGNTAKVGSFTVENASVVADGESTNTLTVKVVDAKGNVLNGQKVTLIAGSGLTLSSTELTSGSDGLATATVKSSTSGSFELSANVKGKPDSDKKTLTVVFIAGEPVVAESSLTVSDSSLVADDYTTVTLTLTLKDAKKNGVPGKMVEFSSSLTGVTFGDVSDNENGTYTATIKGSQTGDAEITVLVNNTKFTVSSVTVKLTADSDSINAKESSLSASPSTITANNIDSSTLTLSLRDKYKNLVPGKTVLFTSDLKNVTISATTALGDGTYTATLKGKAAGTAKVNVKVDNEVFGVSSANIVLIGDSSTAKIDSFTAGNSTVVADGVATNTLTVKVIDANGNVLNNQNITLTADSGVTLSATELTTGSNGLATATVKSSTAGSYNVKAKFKDAEDSTNIQLKVSFIAGSVDKEKSSLSVSPASIVADGSEESKITLTLKDAQENVIVGQENIKFETTLSNVTISDVTDNKDGTYSATLKGTTAGIASLTVKFDTMPFAVASASVTLTAGSAVATKSSLSVSPASIVADGSATSTVTLTLKDAKGNLVSNQSGVKFETTNSTVTLGDVTNNGDGTYSATLTSGKTAGTASISVKFGETAFAVTSASVTLTAGSAVATKSSLSVSPASIVADGSATSTVTLTLKDTNGNLVSNQSGVKFETTNSTVTLGNVMNNGDGTYSATLTSGKTAGTASISVKFDETAFEVASVSVELTADSSTVKVNNITAKETSVVADGTTTNTLTVKVTDANGNILGDQDITLTADSELTLSATALKSGSDGLATATVKSSTSGTFNVKAKIKDKADTTYVTLAVTFVAGSADKDKSSLAVSSDSIVANGSATSTVTLTLKDANNNPVLGQTITFTNSLSNVTIGDTNDVGDGTYTADLTGTTAGINEVKAMLGGKSFAVTSVNVTLTSDSSTAVISSLNIEENNAIADGESNNKVKVIVLDANSNPVSDQAVTFTADNSATLSASEVKTGNDGSAIVRLTSNTKGDSIVTATLKGKTSTKSVRTTFVAAISLDDTSLTASVTQLPADSTSKTEITLNLKDTDKEGIPSQSIKVKSSLSGTTLSSVTDVGDGRYTFTLTSGTRIGDAVITFTVNGVSVNKTVTINIVPDVSSASLSNVGAGVTVSSDNAIANGTAKNTLKVTVTDKNGYLLPDITVTFSSSVGGVTITPTSIKTDSNGEAKIDVTSTKSGTIDISVIVAGVTHNTSVKFKADSSTAKILGQYSIINNNSVADNVAINQVKFYVVDANNNPLSNTNVALTLTGVGTLKSTSLTSASDGGVVAEITSTKAGNSIVTAKVGTSTVDATTVFIGSIKSTSFNNDGSSISVLSDGVFADGLYFSRMKVVLFDSNGNLVNNAVVSLSSNSTNIIIPSTVTTAGDGSATFKVKSSKSGAYQITASINNSSKSSDVNFIDTVNTSLSSIRVSPSTITMNDTSTATVTLYNNEGALIKNASVFVSPSLNGLTSVRVSNQTNNNDGTYTALITPLQTGSVSLTASVSGTIVGLQYATLTITPDEESASFENSGSSLSIYSDNAAADGSVSNAVDIYLADNKGQMVNGKTVSLSLSNGAYFSPDVTSITKTSGSRVNFYSKTAGDSVLTATYNGKSKSITVNFLPNVDLSNSIVSTSAAILEVGNSATISTELYDSDGNKITSKGRYSVYCYSSLDSTTAIATTYNSTTNTFNCNVTSSSSSLVTVSVKVNNKTLTSNAKITFTGSKATAKLDSIQSIVDNATANGSSNNQVKVTVKDSSGNTVSGVTVNFTATNGATIGASGISGSDGTIIMNVSSKKTGTSVITASLTNTTGSVTSLTKSVTFKADSSTASLNNSGSSVSVLVNNAYADGVDKNTLRIIVADSNGNVVPDVTLSFTATNGATISSSAVTSSNGIVDVSLTSSSMGSSTVTTTLDGISITTEVTFTKAYSNTQSTLTASATEIQADGLEKSTITLLLKDSDGVIDENATVTFISSLKGVELNNQKNLGQGKYSIDLTSQIAGKVNISVMINNAVRNITPAVVTIKGVANDASVLNTGAGIEVNTNNADADGTSLNVLIVTITDKSGNPIADKEVALSGTNNVKFSNGLSSITLTTGTDGKIKFGVNNIYSGTSRITATLNGTVSTDINFNRAFSNSLSVLKLTNESILADGNESTTITLEPKDYSGVSFTALENVSFSLSDGEYVVLSAVSENTSGSYSATMTSTKAKTITVSPVIDGTIIGEKTVSVEFKPLSISKIYTLDDVSTKIGFDAINGTTNGYPTIGYETGWNTAFHVRLYFTDSNGSNLSNSAYTWSSDQSWVTVENGVVTFTSMPTTSNRTVTIKATYPGYDDYTYTFTISKWFKVLYGFNIYSSVNSECVKSGGTLPIESDVVTNPKKTGVKGTLYGEHGNIRTSGGNWHWLGEQTENGVYKVYNKNGSVSTDSLTDYNYKLCMYDL